MWFVGGVDINTYCRDLNRSLSHRALNVSVHPNWDVAGAVLAPMTQETWAVVVRSPCEGFAPGLAFVLSQVG